MRNTKHILEIKPIS